MAVEAQVRAAVRDAVNHRSRKPFHWGGLVGYQQLEAIVQALHSAPLAPETTYLQHLAARVDRALERSRTRANDVAAAHDWLLRIADCLRYPRPSSETPKAQQDLPLTSGQVRREMEGLLKEFQPDLKRKRAQAALFNAWHRLWRTCGPDLLHCYDIHGLPADNLKLEALFGRLRRHQRRISGRKSTRPLRDFGQHQVLFAAESEAELLEQLRQVPLEDYQAQRRRLQEAEAPRQQLYRLHRDPVGAMRQLVDQHAARRAALGLDAAARPPPLHTD